MQLTVPLRQEIHAVHLQSHVQANTNPLQEVGAVPGDVDAYAAKMLCA